MRCSLPVAPFGISATNTTLRGTLKSATRVATKSRSSRSVHSLAGTQHDHRAHLLAELGVRDGEGDALLDRGMVHQDDVRSRSG